MRWERLFDDLEAQLTGEEAREQEAEVADRTRRERALVPMHARLLANLGSGPVSVRVPGRLISGRLVDVGPDWVLLEARVGRPDLVSLSSVRGVTGLAPGSLEPSVVAKRFGLGAALRAVSRDRATVQVLDLDGRVMTGTIDVVGADHLELAEHPSDAPRRHENVVAVHLIPFAALVAVRRA